MAIGEDAGVGETPDSRVLFRSLLRDRLREKPYPLFCFAEGVIPAASVWTGSRLWVDAFRAVGLVRGDRLLVTLPPSAAWLQVFVAAVWEGLTIALAPEQKTAAEFAALLEAVDARAGVSLDTGEILSGVFEADLWSGPAIFPPSLRATRFPATPDARFLLRTSGTESGGGKWIALSDTNVLSVIQSHQPCLGLQEAESRVLSVLPWPHAFGLVIDLLPALFSGAEIHRAADGGRDIDRLLDFSSTGITDFCAVPLTIKRLLQSERGRRFLQSLHGGVIGGASIDAELTMFLRSTRLRVGYGQTEASPGIALGEPGYFPVARYLGRALGCEARIGETGTAQFRGANACIGFWSPGNGYEPLDPHRWQDTGDIVTHENNSDLFFRGRIDAGFKLANGRRVEAELLENTLRSAILDAEHLLLFTRDEDSLEIASDTSIPFAVACDALGTLGKLLKQIHLVPQTCFSYTPKGTLRRTATRDAILSLPL